MQMVERAFHQKDCSYWWVVWWWATAINCEPVVAVMAQVEMLKRKEVDEELEPANVADDDEVGHAPRYAISSSQAAVVSTLGQKHASKQGYHWW